MYRDTSSPGEFVERCRESAEELKPRIAARFRRVRCLRERTEDEHTGDAEDGELPGPYGRAGARYDDPRALPALRERFDPFPAQDGRLGELESATGQRLEG